MRRLLILFSPSLSTLHPLSCSACAARVKSLVAPDEPLTPGILYVGVATLTGSVLARNRLFWRLALPPALFILSLNHFLPKTSHNVSQYLGSLEEEHFPALAETPAIANAHTAMTWERIKDATQGGQDAVSGAVGSLVGQIEEVSGLKLRETLGMKGQTKTVAQAVEEKAAEVVNVVEKDAGAAKAVVDATVEETVEKAKEVKRLV